MNYGRLDSRVGRANGVVDVDCLFDCIWASEVVTVASQHDCVGVSVRLVTSFLHLERKLISRGA